MTHCTVKLASYESYLADEYAKDVQASYRDLEERERQAMLQKFPHSAVLQLAYAELDYSNRWCWEHFGPSDGECMQSDSEYRTCERVGPHSHEGRWHSRWLAKTDYDFGYNEWYFASAADRADFLEFVPGINWGEHYPK